MSRENLEGVLGRLAQAEALPDLHLVDGYCLVRIDGKIDLAIEFEEDTQSVILTARCGALPAVNRERVLQELTDANFYGAGSGGATLCTNSREGGVYLQFRESTLHLEPSRMQDLLRAIIVNAEFWGARLEKLDRQPAPPTPDTPAHTFVRA